MIGQATSGGEECGAPGDLVNWEEAEWTLHSQAKVVELDKKWDWLEGVQAPGLHSRLQKAQRLHATLNLEADLPLSPPERIGNHDVLIFLSDLCVDN